MNFDYILPVVSFVLGNYSNQILKIADRDLAVYPERKKNLDALDYLFNEETFDDPIPLEVENLFKRGGARNLLEEAERIFCPRIYHKISKLNKIIEDVIEKSDRFDEVKSQESKDELKNYIWYIKKLIREHSDFEYYEKEFFNERKILRHNKICGIFSYFWDYKLEPLIHKILSIRRTKP